LFPLTVVTTLLLLLQTCDSAQSGGKLAANVPPPSVNRTVDPETWHSPSSVTMSSLIAAGQTVRVYVGFHPKMGSGGPAFKDHSTYSRSSEMTWIDRVTIIFVTC